jgi:hypothetical protein
LRRTGHRQLSFVFADSPQGGGETGTPDASGGRAFLLHTAKRKRTARTVAGTADTSRLLEEVASTANLAQALLKVIRNQGALAQRVAKGRLKATEKIGAAAARILARNNGHRYYDWSCKDGVFRFFEHPVHFTREQA